MSNERVLIADDHGVFRECLANMLQNAGLEVVAVCGNGLEAVSLAAGLQPDVVLLDVTMPQLDGISAIDQIHVGSPDCRVIMLTMHEAQEVCQRALAAGASGYVVKVDTFSEVLQAIATGTPAAPYVSESARPPQSVAGKGISAHLTPRELEVLERIAVGKTSRRIAHELGISMKTVDVHRTNLMRKLNLHTVADLVRYAMQTGIA